MTSQPITICCGGARFVTFRSTLRDAYPGSVLERMLDESNERLLVRMDDGAIFFDFPPPYFEYLLDCARTLPASVVNTPYHIHGCTASRWKAFLDLLCIDMGTHQVDLDDKQVDMTLSEIQHQERMAHHKNSDAILGVVADILDRMQQLNMVQHQERMDHHKNSDTILRIAAEKLDHMRGLPGPRGDMGPPGPVGMQGIPGMPGMDGVCTCNKG